MAMNALGLKSPRNGAVIDTPLTAILEWDAVPGADSYKVRVARGGDFHDIVFEESCVIGTSWSPGALPRHPILVAGFHSHSNLRPLVLHNPSPRYLRECPCLGTICSRAAREPFLPFPLRRILMSRSLKIPRCRFRRGFDKTSYDCGPKPSFDEIKSEIPAPILDGDDNRALIDAYWFAWKLLFDFGLYEPEEPGQAVFSYHGDQGLGFVWIVGGFRREFQHPFMRATCMARIPTSGSMTISMRDSMRMA